ncbi:MAG TPA: M1 family aminopeptidase [Actinomycetota bacterium]|nr:M1 family aminopeptidase [Actinomycetota bacterium]
MALSGACSDDVRTLPAPVTERPQPSPPATEEARGCETPTRSAPPDAAPHYDMSIRVDPRAGVVSGRSTVTFVGDRATRRLVFRLWPNGPRLAGEGTELTVENATLVEGRASVASPDPTTLVFDLRRRLRPGDEVTARLRWRLVLPGPIYDRISNRGDTVRLGSFFPILSWEGERGWATDPPTTTLAEASTSPTADFDVTIRAPQGLDVIATGREEGGGRWSAQDVRDFAVAVGEFRTVRYKLELPRPVDVVVGVATGLDRDPRDFADAIERALKDLSRRYGPYPWETLSMAIVPDLGRSGIEYPTMIFQGRNSLRTATTHEVAHSWFYGLVGNNQARDPWLDEGVTSWAQARGDGILDYFRDFEVSGAAAGQLGRGMTFWDAREESYYAGVYAQGVKALDALGDPPRTDCALRRYVAVNAYGVATPADLVDALRETYPRAERILARFGVRS